MGAFVVFIPFFFFLGFAENMSRRSSRTLYVGNLPGDIREREVEDLFYKVRANTMFLRED